MKDCPEYILEQVQKLLSIDSPSGYTRNVTDWLLEAYSEMGYQPQRTAKGGILVQISEGSCGHTGRHGFLHHRSGNAEADSVRRHES